MTFTQIRKRIESRIKFPKASFPLLAFSLHFLFPQVDTEFKVACNVESGWDSNKVYSTGVNCR